MLGFQQLLLRFFIQNLSDKLMGSPYDVKHSSGQTQ